MARFDPTSAASPPVWVDGTAYTAKLLAGGAPPWLDADTCAQWLNKGQGLLKSAARVVPVEQIIRAWLEANAGLAADMDAKSRSIYPLKVLLGDAGLRGHVQNILRALGSGNVPMTLSVPSPRAWLGLAQQLAGRDINTDADSVDSAAMYVADWLREVADGGTDIDVILLVEAANDLPHSDDDLGLYGSVYNVAKHRQWQVGLQWPGNTQGRHDALAFTISDDATPGGGLRLNGGQWANGDKPDLSAAAFYAVQIPAEDDPETVLQRLDALRAG